jgi:protocatechuate 3,4-dioxygenase beta subunit
MRPVRTSSIVLGIVALSIAGSVSAQEVIIRGTRDGVELPRMAPREMKTGTGRITGQVTSAESGAPVRRAQVRIMGPEIGAKSAMTDADGKYEFRDLPAGRFTINASKSGFVTVQYGQTRPHESGRPIELADKQVLQKTDISMPRGGVISGRIVDEFGEPVSDAVVSAMRQTWANGRRRFVPSGRTMQTNDLGQFRIYGLPPGDYYVSATLRNMEGMVFDVLGTHQGGPTGSSPESGYAPTYFPGTTSPTDAQKIALGPGQDVQSTDFALIAVRLAKISGIVINSDGKPAEGTMVSASPVNKSGEVALMGLGALSARTSKQGAFTITNVAPGDYMLNVRGLQVMTSTDGGSMTRMVFTATVVGGPGGGSDSEFASVPVSVAGEDLPNVTIVTTRGGTATGRLVFDGGTRPANAKDIRIMASATDFDGPMMGGGGATMKEDGSFELKGLAGTRLIRVGNLPAGWMLKAVRLNGTDITDTGAEFKSGEAVSGLEVVVTSRLTELNGRVSGSDGNPVKDYTVVIFSEDSEMWTLPMSRWVTGARPDQDGRFKVRNLPPGSYYAIAVDYVEQGAWGDPDLLERLKGSARRFTLGEGTVENLDLRISGMS